MTGENQIPNRKPDHLVAKPYQILCLSGGGFRGLYTASLLEKLEQEAGKALSEVFDLIAGTSIGGILALGLASGRSATKLRESFEANADRIFPRYREVKGHKVFPRVPRGILKARYPQTGLRDTLKEILGERSTAPLCAGLATHVLISSVDLNERGPRIFRTSDPDCNVSLLDVGLATSAAPTYFPEHTIGSNLVVDGGLIANAPDMISLIEALKTEPLESIRMLSVGTAGREGARAYRKAKSPGLIGSAKDTFFLTLDAQEQLSVMAVGDLLRDRYLRIDVKPSASEREAIGLDIIGTRAAETLKLMAARTWNEQQPPNQARFREMLNRRR